MDIGIGVDIDMDVDSDMIVSISFVGPFAGDARLLSRGLGLMSGVELILTRTTWLLLQIGGPFVGVLILRAPVLGVDVRAPDFGKLPYELQPILLVVAPYSGRTWNSI